MFRILNTLLFPNNGKALVILILKSRLIGIKQFSHDFHRNKISNNLIFQRPKFKIYLHVTSDPINITTTSLYKLRELDPEPVEFFEVLFISMDILLH